MVAFRSLRQLSWGRLGLIVGSKRLLPLGGCAYTGGFTLFATFVANRFWETPLPKRYATENSFFEHLGLVGGFILVAWYDLQR
jgi:uncharacterized membrane protein YphA (DoxX/SURF4 family)